MQRPARQPEFESAFDEILGYLNFSSGSPDLNFRRHVNEWFVRHQGGLSNDADAWPTLAALLRDRLDTLAESREPFRNADQARAVLNLAFEQVPAAYRNFHRDLLHHQPDGALWRPYFLTRVCETILRLGPPWLETERLVTAALEELNDFVGYRPVAVLRMPRKVEPYDHEWVCPIPLFLQGVGVAAGKYHDLVARALELLAEAPVDVLDQAGFDPALLDEYAVDPRAYDFDHPVNKRPNYQFGQWDPHRLDNQGRFRRFVVQEVTLDAIWQRTQEPSDMPADERLFEAGAVLAGVTLMASAMSGRSPETHGSNVTLSTLLPQIAALRESFYQHLLSRREGAHGERLRAEAATLHQPFGGARQHLNTRLARLRATQLQHVHLAQLFARMGYPDASHRQAEIVPVASARMMCEINSLLTSGHHALERGQTTPAVQALDTIVDLLHRAIECGALVDPWNMLGFQGQFSLFPAVENSVRDHRVDVLIHLVREIFRLFARAQGEAAAAGLNELEVRLSGQIAKLARWWDQFASAEISGLDSFSGREAAESAKHVANALGAWHQGGEASGDLAFWREHVARFQSPKAYSLVIEALLWKRDFVAARALLVQWLGRVHDTPLVHGSYSFHALAVLWMRRVHGDADVSGGMEVTTHQLTLDERWNLTRKLFDYFESNADDYGETPRFEWSRSARPQRDEEWFDDEDDDSAVGETFQAAYEEVTYRDSTADGVEGEMLEHGREPTEDQLAEEATRIANHLQYLVTLAHLWKLAAVRTMGPSFLGGGEPTGRGEIVQGWIAQAAAYQRDLLALLESVSAYQLTPPGGAHEKLVEYDRRRRIKEGLLARVIVTCVEMADSSRQMQGSCELRDELAHETPWERLSVQVLHALFRGETAALRARFPAFLEELSRQPILYVPLSKNGDARRIVEAQNLQQVVALLLRNLPRLGLLSETCQLIAAAQEMEQNRPKGEGVVTEFDRLFELGYRSMVECLVHAAPPPDAKGDESVSDHELIDGLQKLTESMLMRWLEHSRSLRLSALEKVADKERWHALEQFIRDYGHDLFTPRWFNLSNLRAILHQGIDAYLAGLAEEPELSEGQQRLIDALDQRLPRAVVVESLTIIVEAIVENYAEFKDFNNTTTQSDRGELLYTLLDFLRLKASYQRFAWTIRPVNLAHEVLVATDRLAAAELWRRAVAQRTSDVADWHLRRWQDLCRQHGMRLPTIGDLLQERFVRPLAIDRMRALVRPAIDEARQRESPVAFHLLEQEINEFAETPTGAGLDVPAWILALEHEVNQIIARGDDDDLPSERETNVAWQAVAWDDLLQQLRSVESPDT